MYIGVSKLSPKLCPREYLDCDFELRKTNNGIPQNTYRRTCTSATLHWRMLVAYFSIEVCLKLERRLTFMYLVSIARAYPSSPISNPNIVHLPSSLSFGSAAQPPSGSCQDWSTMFTNPASSICFFIWLETSNVCPLSSPAAFKAYWSLEWSVWRWYKRERKKHQSFITSMRWRKHTVEARTIALSGNRLPSSLFISIPYSTCSNHCPGLRCLESIRCFPDIQHMQLLTYRPAHKVPANQVYFPKDV